MKTYKAFNRNGEEIRVTIPEDAPKTSQEKELERYQKTAALWAKRKQRWNAFKRVSR